MSVKIAIINLFDHVPASFVNHVPADLKNLFVANDSDNETYRVDWSEVIIALLTTIVTAFFIAMFFLYFVAPIAFMLIHEIANTWNTTMNAIDAGVTVVGNYFATMTWSSLANDVYNWSQNAVNDFGRWLLHI